MKQKLRWWIALIAFLGVTACNTDTPPTPTVAAPAATTEAPSPAATVVPTATIQPPTPTPLPSATATEAPTAVPTSTPVEQFSYPVLTLDPVDDVVRAYPGPVHYEGDLLTLEINVGQYVEATEGPVQLQLNRQDPFTVDGQWSGYGLLVPLDTTGLTGSYQLSIRAEHDGVRVNESVSLDLEPATERPAQEADPVWETRTIPCCVLHYISDTAAARDIDEIAETVQDAANEFDELPGVDINETIDIYLIDRMWGNGGFGGGGELLAVYTDRHYGPTRGDAGLQVLVRHELGHAVDFDAPFFRYSEGLSVFLAGGHYKPEPLPARGAAMLALHYYGPSRGPSIQHEIFYLYQATVVNYIADAYGWDTLWQYVEADSQSATTTPEQQEEALQDVMGITVEEFENGYFQWLQDQEPGEQVEDLALTIRLQDARRTYQDEYAPPPRFLLGIAQDSHARPDFIHVNIREARSPANMATELLIANAQQAIIDGQYDEAETLIDVIEEVVDSGQLDSALARDYGAVVYELAEQGYETVSLILGDARATVEVTQSPPELETLTLARSNGRWEIQPAGAPTAEPMAPGTAPATTPTLVPTAAPATAADPEPPADALYFDDFSDPESGWESHSEEKVEIGYAGGAYRIWLDFANGFYWFDSGNTFGDVAVETRVTLRDGPELNRFGLMCNYDADSGSMIQLLIDGRGRYGILTTAEGLPAFVGMDGMQESDAIRPAGEPNLLRAVCAGDTVTFYANGAELATVDGTGSGGDVGLALGTTGGAGIDVAYDYLLVTEP